MQVFARRPRQKVEVVGRYPHVKVRTTTTNRIRMFTSEAMNYVGAGIILVNFEGDTTRYLLLRGTESGVWSFSKGHPEICDRNSPLRTAVRETQEETGLRCGLDYDIMGDALRFGKRPYWIGIVRPESTGEIRLTAREHNSYGWFTVDEILAMNTNCDVRTWVKKAKGPSKFSHTMGVITSMISGQTRRAMHSTAVACNAS
jgi:8-oxo-dGTP pyrophosphatase MutT (NUDIX family)